jgi:hypothetical protein
LNDLFTTPLLPSLLFIGLTIFLFSFISFCLKIGFRSQPKLALLLKTELLIWITTIGALSIFGFFNKFDTVPPRFFFILAPVILLLLFTTKSKAVRPIFLSVPQTWLIGIQSFRIVMELILFILAKQHIAPELMTWDGRNFDIFIGLTAPLIVYSCFTLNIFKPSIRNEIVLIWNFLGIALLGNVVINGFLATPTIFQTIQTVPENTFIGSFPYSWLPGFVVPTALFFHIMSIRKCLTDQSTKN